MANDNLQVKILVDQSALTSGMKEATAVVEQAGAQMKASFAEAGVGAEKLEYSVGEARHALRGFGEEIGVHMPRFVSSFVAGLGGVGPALAAAFTPIAVIGLIEVLKDAIEKVAEFTSRIFILTDAAKELYAAQIKGNAAILAGEHEQQRLLREIQLIGLSALEQDKLRAQWAQQDRKDKQDEVEAKQKTLALARQELDLLERKQATAEPTSAAEGIAITPNFTAQIQAAREKIDSLNLELGILQKELKVSGSESDLAGKKLSEAAKKAAAAKAEEVANDAAYTAKLVAEDQKAHEKQMEMDEEFHGAEVERTRKGAEEDLRILQENIRKKQKSYDEDLRNIEELARAKGKTALATADYELAAGQISARQATDLKLKALDDEYAIEKAAIQKRIDLIDDADPNAPDKRKQLYTQLLVLDEQYQTARLGVEIKNVNAIQKLWGQAFTAINHTLNAAIQGLVSGTESFGSAFIRMLDDMVAKFIQAMAQMAVQWIATHVLMLTVKKSIHQQEVLADAKAAAAAAWKAVAGIPVIGPILAPVAAATAFAGVEAFSAKGGMEIVPADNTVALLHAREMVLPAHVADAVRAGAGGGIAGPTFHFTVNAIDARGVAAVLEQQQDTIVKVLRRAQREGRYGG
jgi:hypothetical protein